MKLTDVSIFSGPIHLQQTCTLFPSQVLPLLIVQNRNRECELIQLLCSPDAPPILERRASLPRLNDQIAAYHFRLNGNVVCVQGSDLVYLWNWRDGTRGWVCDHDRVGEVWILRNLLLLSILTLYMFSLTPSCVETTSWYQQKITRPMFTRYIVSNRFHPPPAPSNARPRGSPIGSRLTYRTSLVIAPSLSVQINGVLPVRCRQ